MRQRVIFRDISSVLMVSMFNPLAAGLLFLPGDALGGRPELISLDFINISSSTTHTQSNILYR